MHPWLCLGVKMFFPLKGKRSKAGCARLPRRHSLFTLLKDRVSPAVPQGPPPPQQPQPLPQRRNRSGERQRGYKHPGHPVPDSLPGAEGRTARSRLREGRMLQWEGAPHPAASSQLAQTRSSIPGRLNQFLPQPGLPQQPPLPSWVVAAPGTLGAEGSQCS